MDYKTNILSNKIETEKGNISEFPNLKIGSLDNDTTLFDYTDYIDAEKLEPIDYKVFMRNNKRYINALAKAYDISTDKLFYQSPDGHILINIVLIYLCLAYINPVHLMYFNLLVNDAITTGVAYSNMFAYDMASARIPSDELNNIIKERELDEEREEQQSNSDSSI